MTDDKAIEAALDAWCGIRWRRIGSTHEHHAREDMRAAIAAADEARAERFDAEKEAKACLDRWENGPGAMDGYVAEALRRAFAAGLAKGEAERERVSNERDAAYIAAQIAIAERNAARDQIAKGEADKAALVEALTEIRASLSEAHSAYFEGVIAHCMRTADAALALVRKGV